MAYTDGSCLGGPSRLTPRCGWAFVAVNSQGGVIAVAHGVPTPWIDTIGGAEDWALVRFLLFAYLGTVAKIDCKMGFDLIASGVENATLGSRLLARLFTLIFANVGQGVSRKQFVWMPAHTSEQDVGVMQLSDESTLTDVDRFGNDYADRLAKEAVEEHRVPEALRLALVEHEQLQVATYRWLASATLLANSKDEGT